MLLKRTNIEHRLQRVRAGDSWELQLVSLLKGLHIGDSPENHGNDGAQLFHGMNPDLLEPARIYHLSHIRKICIDYRLRFLDLGLFKPELPPQAIYAMHQLEIEHGIQITGCKIIAPSRLFRLKDRDDPLLFAPLGDDYFYLVHKWGNDLHPLRRIFAWPFRGIGNLALVVLLTSFLATLIIPEGLFSNRSSSAEFWIIFFFMFKSLAAVVIFYGFALGKNFNPGIWDSRYFNS